MGGVRCTYRNCNVKSDGKTHMFHFPVFDKVRCHQWLVNAQRLDLLDLTVSQLKNRSICQHHFEADRFMNYKQDKLTFDAVPTINGPFCDPSKGSSGDTKKCPKSILVEDIENDFDIYDKKSIFSLKYADFLTNNRFVDSSARYNQTKDNAGINLNSYLYIKDKNKTSLEPNNIRLELLTKKKKKVAPKQMTVICCNSSLSNELKMGKELNLEQNLIDSQSDLNLTDKYSKPKLISHSSSAQSVSKQELSLKQNLTDPLLNLNLEDKSVDIPDKSKVFVTTKPKIEILSEKVIKAPVKFGNIPDNEIISQPCPLRLQNKKTELQDRRRIEDRRNTQDDTIADLEERMKEIEHTLLNRITQISQQVIEIKNTLKDSFQVGKKHKEQSNKRVVSTQTEDSEPYKRFLFQEISEFLSPSLKSMICEQLFQNNYSCVKRQRRFI